MVISRGGGEPPLDGASARETPTEPGPPQGDDVIVIRRYFFAVFLVASFATASIGGVAAAPSGVVERVDVDAFRKLVDSGQATLLDLRTPAETRKGQIAGSSSIDFLDPSFAGKVARLEKGRPLLVYCASGGRSAKAAERLRGMGFSKVYDLAGGIRAWQSKGYAVTAPEVGGKDGAGRSMTPGEFRKLLETPGPVLADFHTNWCIPCRKMAPVVDRLAAALGKRATVLRVDVDESRELADVYKIEGIPVFILFDKGKEVWRGNGIILEAELRKRIEERLSPHP